MLPIARYARSTKPHVYAHGHSISQPILLVGDHVEGAERPGRNDIEIMHSVSAQERSRIISGYHWWESLRRAAYCTWSFEGIVERIHLFRNNSVMMMFGLLLRSRHLRDTMHRNSDWSYGHLTLFRSAGAKIVRTGWPWNTQAGFCVQEGQRNW